MASDENEEQSHEQEDGQEEEYLAKITSTQPNNFKTLFSILKDNTIDEANIIISPAGIEILEMDLTRVVIVHIMLEADKFDSYYCRDTVKIGVNTVDLAKILKSVGAKDTLTLIVENPENQDGATLFGLLIENAEKGQSTKIRVPIIDVNDGEFKVPELDYTYHIQLPSSDLQSIVNGLKGIGGEVIRIFFHRDCLKFFTKGDLGSLETTRTKSKISKDDSIKIMKGNNQEESNIIEIYVKLEKMFELVKCSSLSTIVTIYLRNDFPVFLEYDVGSLGRMRIGVGPHNKPDDF